MLHCITRRADGDALGNQALRASYSLAPLPYGRSDGGGGATKRDDCGECTIDAHLHFQAVTLLISGLVLVRRWPQLHTCVGRQMFGQQGDNISCLEHLSKRCGV